MTNRIAVLCGLLLLSISALAQVGPHRPSTKWKQIDTDTVQVVFSDGLEKQAQRVASMVHALASDSSQKSVGPIAEKVTIILRNQTGIPNGFVAPSPFRSEFFTTSPQYNFGGTTNWLDLLSIHEYRHVLQNQNAKIDVTKIGSILFGQNGWWFMTGTAFPRWYIEGDAVVSETVLTQSGRGRMPHFDMEYRALRTEGKHYNYEKASAGSYKDFVPNHYVLGYHLTGYARKQFGRNIWADVLQDAAAFKGLLFPFSRNLKKRTGLSTPKLYQESMSHLDSIYESISHTPTLDNGKALTKTPKTYTDYRQPIFLSNDKMVVVKSGLEDIPTFYELDLDGNMKRMFQPGFNTDLNFQVSAGDGMITWSEITYHPRWALEDYSIIKVANLASDLGQKPLSSQSKYFSPALSKDNLQLAVISRDPKNLSAAIKLLSISTGKEVKTLPNPNGYRYHHLRWFPDGSSLLTVLRQGQQNALARVDVATGDVSLLTGFTTEHISQPYPSEEWVFFSATHTGTNNIYAVKPNGGDIYQVTDAPLGAFDPSVSPNGQKLAYSSFSSLGYQVQLLDIKPDSWKKLQESTVTNHLPLYVNTSDVADSAFVGGLEEQEFETSAYKPLAHLFNIHSWNPVLSDPNQREVGLDLEIDDKMRTFSTTLGYRYNLNERRGRFTAEVAYAGLFPVLRAGLIGNDNRVATRYEVIPTDTTDTGDVTYSGLFNSQEWTETSIYAGVTIPLNLTFGNMFTSLDLSANLQWHQLEYQRGDERFSQGLDESIQSLDFILDFGTFKQQAQKHLFPRLGFGAYARYRSTLGDSFNQGSNFIGQAYAFLPSPFKTHGLRVLLSHNSTDQNATYRFTNFFGGSRGYGVPPHDRATKFAATYAIPIAYPDMALGPLAFIQRIKARPFFDYTNYQIDRVASADGQVASSLIDIDLKSVGMELLFDFRIMRLLDAEMGVRYSYLMDYEVLGNSSPHSFEFVFLNLTP